MAFLLLLPILLLFIRGGDSHLLIADRTMTRMIQFTAKSPFCYLFTDRDFIQTTILNTPQRNVKICSDEEIGKLEEICRKKQLRTSYQGGFIYPGTKWCGPGNVAQNMSDLGTHAREDMCCREHDNCPHSLARGECKKGICNKSLFTRSHCDCDATFRRCLQNVNSETANTIGAIFFNVVQVICFKQRSPCSDHQSENLLNGDECEIEFVKTEKFEPGEVVFPYQSRGAILEGYFNRFLRKIHLL